MKVEIEATDKDGNILKCYVSSDGLYDALAKLLGLIEVKPNFWVNEHKEYYILTKHGFKRVYRPDFLIQY